MLPNVPAIQMEEVLPIAVSKAATLAPQEVYAHKKAVEMVLPLACSFRYSHRSQKGSSEMTHEDRKRKRKKIKETHKKKEAEKAHRKRVRDAIDPAGKKQVTEKEALADIKKSKNVVVGKKTTSSKDTKSTTFFTKLQEQVQSGGAGRKPTPVAAQKDRFAAQASFLKL